MLQCEFLLTFLLTYSHLFWILEDRRCLDISLLAEPSSDEETTDVKTDKSLTGSEPKKRGRRKKNENEVKKVVVAEVKVAAVVGKENQHQNGVPVRGRKRKEETAGGRKAKKSRTIFS